MKKLTLLEHHLITTPSALGITLVVIIIIISNSMGNDNGCEPFTIVDMSLRFSLASLPHTPKALFFLIAKNFLAIADNA